MKKIWSKKVVNSIFVVLIAFLVSGCLGFSSQRLLLNQDISFNRYDEIKHIVMEEAYSNGFRKLTAEIKPSKHNDWEGQLYFKLATSNGTDQLTVELTERNGKISVYMYGAGSKTNPGAAIKGIQERLDKAGMGEGNPKQG